MTSSPLPSAGGRRPRPATLRASLRASLRNASALVAAALLLACSPPKKAEPGAPAVPDKQYAGTPEGLHELWADILTACQKDDRGRVHDLMQTLVMTDDELVELFGPELGAYLKPRYRPMASRMANVGALELVALVLERKYDDAEVVPLTPDSPDIEVRASLGALKVKTPAYAVRVKRKVDAMGLKYNFFVFHHGRWVTGNQFAKFFAPPRDTTNTSTGVALSPHASPGATPATPAAGKGGATGAGGKGSPAGTGAGGPAGATTTTPATTTAPPARAR